MSLQHIYKGKEFIKSTFKSGATLVLKNVPDFMLVFFLQQNFDYLRTHVPFKHERFTFGGFTWCHIMLLSVNSQSKLISFFAAVSICSDTAEIYEIT